MTKVKKQYTQLVELLEANSNKKISTIMPEILELVTSKQAQKNFITNENGEVTHIFCYYHKKWEYLADVEFGKKKHSASGYNSMCKEGVNQWSKQQREYKQAQSDALTKVAKGELDTQGLNKLLAQIEEEKDKIVPREDGSGSDII